MRIGIDLDNTIVCYDGLFHDEAVARGWIERTVSTDKESVRRAFCDADREDRWTAIQGEVYGRRIRDAKPFPGVRDAMVAWRSAGHDLFIVSHKTRRPYAGPPYDLHEAARDWLTANRILADEAVGLTDDRVWLELAREAKLSRIGALGCDVFIDDLPRFLADPAFPNEVRPVLFDPTDRHDDGSFAYRTTSWAGLREWVLHETVLH